MVVNKFSLFFIGLLVSTLTFSDVVPISTQIPAEIKRIQTDNAGDFYIVYGNGVQRYRHGKHLAQIKPPAKDGWSVSVVDSTVSGDGTVYFHSTYAKSYDNGTWSKLDELTICKQHCKSQRLGSYSSSTERKPDFGELRTAPNGTVVSSYIKKGERYIDGKKKVYQDHYFYVDGVKKAEELEYKGTSSGYEAYRASYEKAFLYDELDMRFNAPELFGTYQPVEKDRQWLVKGVEYKTKMMPRYDRRAAFFKGKAIAINHDAKTSSLVATFFDGKDLQEYPLDKKDSGQENAVIVAKDRLVVFSYFRRDPRNKGLLVTEIDENATRLNQYALDVSPIRNAGWNISAAMNKQGNIMLAYTSNVHEKKNSLIYFDSLADLRQASDRLTTEGHALGREFADQMVIDGDVSGEELGRSYFKSKKALRLTASVGSQYQFRKFWDRADDKAEDEGLFDSNRLNARYEVDPSFVQIFEFSGGAGDTSFGGEVVSDFADTSVSNSTGTSEAGVKTLKGWLGFKKLFMNFDVGVAYETTKYGINVVNEGTNFQRSAEVEFEELRVELFDFHSNTFGLTMQSSNTLLPAHRYRKAANSSRWSYDQSGIYNADVKKIGLFYGRSSLDYLSKFETDLSKIYFDGTARLGMMEVGIQDEERFNTEQYRTADFGFRFEIGYAKVKRSNFANGLGYLLRVGYRTDFSMTGTGLKESEDMSDGFIADEKYGYISDRMELRHGPIARFSLLY